MSALKIEERIAVSAPPDRVWRFLLDPARVAACLPGARLDGVEDDRTFLGTMKVKVGPVTMEFKGKATMSEVDEGERRVVLTGTGSDKSGSGSAKMAMNSQIVAVAHTGSEIVVVADVDLAGKLVGFGRGMMAGVSKQLFKQFAERVRAELAAEESAGAAPAEGAAATAATETAITTETANANANATTANANANATTTETATPAATETATATETPTETAAANADGEGVAGAGEAAKGEAAADQGAPAAEAAAPEAAKVPEETKAPEATKAKGPAASALAREENAPLDAGGLVWSALWEWIKGIFRRLFGRRA